MATALDLITRAMRLNTAIGEGETPSDSEANTGLDVLNTMLDSWSINELMVYEIQQENFAVSAGTGSYTIGSGGAFNTVRPVEIMGGFFRDSGSNDYPFNSINLDWWNGLSPKTEQAVTPQYLYYEPAYPLGIINLWPVPSSSGTLFIDSMKALQSFAALTTVLALPPGYKRAIEYNLAVELAPEFEREPPLSVVKVANESLANIKRINAPDPVLGLDDGLVYPRGIYDINRGY